MFKQFVALKQLVVLSQWETGLLPQQGLEYMIALLPALRTLPHLEEIVLAVDMDVYSGKNLIDIESLEEWRILDGELTTSPMPAFRRLFIIVESTAVMDPDDPLNKVYLPSLAASIRLCMPRSVVRGILDVCAEEVSKFKAIYI